MKKLKLNYACTDPDCAQYMAKVTDTRYSYIEYREWFGNYIVCHAVVDLQDYTLDEICTYCSSYYASLEQMVADYGFRGALQIMAECIFEQLGFATWSLMQNKKVKAPQSSSFTNGWRADLIWRYIR